MAGGEDSAEAAQLRGLSKYFNSVTITGRANVAKLTYAVCAGIGLWVWLRPKSPSTPQKKGPPPIKDYAKSTYNPKCPSTATTTTE